jgi:predicted amidophosphoribosyltransferase
MQESMSVEERVSNQTGSMAIDRAWIEKVKGRDIVLIDDVVTSGATLGVAAETLAQGGVNRISCLLLARAVPRP